MNKKLLETIDTVYRCEKCKEFFALKDMVKIPKNKIPFIQTQEQFTIICKECVKK